MLFVTGTETAVTANLFTQNINLSGAGSELLFFFFFSCPSKRDGIKWLVCILFLLYLHIGAIHNGVSSALGIVSVSSIPAELLQLAGR